MDRWREQTVPIFLYRSGGGASMFDGDDGNSNSDGLIRDLVIC